MANQLDRVGEGYNEEVGQSTQFSTNQVVVGTTGFSDVGSTEAFGACCDPSGNLFVSDSAEHIIMKIRPGGEAVVYAGEAGTSGNNGSNVVSLSDARFDTPRSLCSDRRGNIFVADAGNNQIRKISPDGYVTLLAGDPAGASGYVNGSSARFNAPYGICIDRSNDIMIADTGNHCIRKIKHGVETVYTIAGTDSAGDVVSDSGLEARFDTPKGICCTQGGQYLIADAGNYKIKRMYENGTVSFVAGAGTRGTTVGDASTTQFLDMFYIAVNNSGVGYVVDYDEAEGCRLVKVTPIGTTSVIYNYGADADNAGGVTVNDSGKIFLIESPMIERFYSSSSSSSSA